MNPLKVRLRIVPRVANDAQPRSGWQYSRMGILTADITPIGVGLAGDSQPVELRESSFAVLTTGNAQRRSSRAMGSTGGSYRGALQGTPRSLRRLRRAVRTSEQVSGRFARRFRSALRLAAVAEAGFLLDQFFKAHGRSAVALPP